MIGGNLIPLQMFGCKKPLCRDWKDRVRYVLPLEDLFFVEQELIGDPWNLATCMLIIQLPIHGRRLVIFLEPHDICLPVLPLMIKRIVEQEQTERTSMT